MIGLNFEKDPSGCHVESGLERTKLAAGGPVRGLLAARQSKRWVWCMLEHKKEYMGLKQKINK